MTLDPGEPAPLSHSDRKYTQSKREAARRVPCDRGLNDEWLSACPMNVTGFQQGQHVSSKLHQRRQCLLGFNAWT